jgi:hypothetical protein
MNLAIILKLSLVGVLCVAGCHATPQEMQQTRLASLVISPKEAGMTLTASLPGEAFPSGQSVVPRHREIRFGTAIAICKQLQIPAPTGR